MRKSMVDDFFMAFRVVCFGTCMAVLFLACVAGARAQSESINATMRGRITDPSGQPVAGNTVLAVYGRRRVLRNSSIADRHLYALGDEGWILDSEISRHRS